MPEVSVVMPCLDEEKTVGVCIKKCLKIFKENDIDGEVIVVDNGSVDNSPRVARETGAKVVFEPRKGYGRAYLRGFSEAGGGYIIIGDADNTYDFLEIPKFLKLLNDNHCDFVSGTRLKGKILPNAMPWLHRYVGNPLLTKIFNLIFHTKFSDVYCGFKAFTKEALEKMDITCAGMEFTPEITINAIKANLRMMETPITYHPRDPMTKSKLKSFEDGWRYLRFTLSFVPDRLF